MILPKSLMIHTRSPENNSLVVSQSGISLPELVLSEDFDTEVDFAFTGNVEIEPVWRIYLH